MTPRTPLRSPFSLARTQSKWNHTKRSHLSLLLCVFLIFRNRCYWCYWMTALLALHWCKETKQRSPRRLWRWIEICFVANFSGCKGCKGWTRLQFNFWSGGTHVNSGQVSGHKMPVETQNTQLFHNFLIGGTQVKNSHVPGHTMHVKTQSSQFPFNF